MNISLIYLCPLGGFSLSVWGFFFFCPFWRGGLAHNNSRTHFMIEINLESQRFVAINEKSRIDGNQEGGH